MVAVYLAATLLAKSRGGAGVLLSEVEGGQPGTVVVIGGGTVGTSAAMTATRLGARTVVLETDPRRVEHLAATLPPDVRVLPSTTETVARAVGQADAVIGAVLVPGARPPIVVTREMVRGMKPGAVIVVVSVDQGGCVETTRPTSHESPVHEVEGVIHCGITNLPGAYPTTSTKALVAATTPWVLELASADEAGLLNSRLAQAVNVYRGWVTNREVAACHGLPYRALADWHTGGGR